MVEVEPAAFPEPRVPPASPASPVELLLVDNDARIAELAAWVLARAGYRVRVAGSFRDARAQIAARRPDLLLSDVDLGAESALSELPRLAADGALPPTLVVSGYLDEDKRAALGALPTVVGFLDKPFDPRTLADRVTEALAEARRLPPPLATGASTASSAAGWGDEVDADDGWLEIGGPG